MRAILRGFLFLAAICINAAVWSANALPDGPYVVADGEASVEAVPDYVTLELSVSKTAPTNDQASAAVATISKKIFSVLNKLGIPSEDIRASNLNVSADIDYQHNDKRVYKGQEVSRRFNVTLRDLTKFSDLLRGLLAVNVDEISNIEFSTTHRAEIEKQVIDMAIDSARARAEEMATRAGGHVDKVYAVAPGQYKTSLLSDFPFQENRYGVPEADAVPPPPPPPGPDYVIPKSITVTSGVTIICTLKYTN